VKVLTTPPEDFVMLCEIAVPEKHVLDAIGGARISYAIFGEAKYQ